MIPRKQLVDQSAHAAAAIAALAPLALWPGPLTGALAGFAVGLVREITEEHEVSFAALSRIARSHGSKLDLIFWTIGGAAAGLAAAIT
jgi:hypothetical protein